MVIYLMYNYKYNKLLMINCDKDHSFLVLNLYQLFESDYDHTH